MRRKPNTLTVHALTPRLEDTSQPARKELESPALGDVARAGADRRNRLLSMQLGERSRRTICVPIWSVIPVEAPRLALTWKLNSAKADPSASDCRLDLRIRYSYVLAA